MDLQYHVTEMRFVGEEAYSDATITVRIRPRDAAPASRALILLTINDGGTPRQTATSEAVASRALQAARALVPESQAAAYLLPILQAEMTATLGIG